MQLFKYPEFLELLLDANVTPLGFRKKTWYCTHITCVFCLGRFSSTSGLQTMYSWHPYHKFASTICTTMTDWYCFHWVRLEHLTFNQTGKTRKQLVRLRWHLYIHHQVCLFKQHHTKSTFPHQYKWIPTYSAGILQWRLLLIIRIDKHANYFHSGYRWSNVLCVNHNWISMCLLYKTPLLQSLLLFIL